MVDGAGAVAPQALPLGAANDPKGTGEQANMYKTDQGDLIVIPGVTVPALDGLGNEQLAELRWSYGDEYWRHVDAQWWMGLGAPLGLCGAELTRRWAAGGGRECDGGCGKMWQRDGVPFWRCEGGGDIRACGKCNFCEHCLRRRRAWAEERRSVPRDGSCLYWSMLSEAPYDAARLQQAARFATVTTVCAGCRGGRGCEEGRQSICGRMTTLRRQVAEATRDGEHAQWNAPALAKHVDALATVTKRRVVVVSKEGETWEFGTGDPTFMAWDGACHFEGLSPEGAETLTTYALHKPEGDG